MNIECVREKLSEALSKITRISQKNVTLPILECVFLRAEANNLIIRSTNLDLGVELSIPAKVKEVGSVAVSAQLLYGIISNLSHEKSISLELKDTLLICATESSVTKMKTLPVDDFPTIPRPDNGQEFTIVPNEIIEGLRSVMYSAAATSIKPELSSVMVATDAGELVFAATDSLRLAEKRLKSKKTKDIGTVLIPFKNIADCIKILENYTGEMKMVVAPNQISFIAEGIFLTSRVINGIFPDYKQIIPKEFSSEIICLKEDILNALKIANVFSDSLRQVYLHADSSKKIFEIQTKNAAAGENTNRIDATITGEAVQLSFNYKFISDCFQSIASDSVSFATNGPHKPLIIRGVGDSSFRYLVMPISQVSQ
ncbi:MAG: DNA polymerase III subunit beta [Candidatus Taylorbacteria bacterium RIFCSPLOWO2_01_FULL_45_15b]|uniref:Beta sliding clamp n=1 Tax=Candidatus Taylorbacteria bacterium RIFCSPLOWO2_01_FULL_45_15b TaxID=1802319 RepID=A0A1G2N8T6_9BACT|nr:MAG: DNA polymerase III subunit beta [Candidatus Taylorbacteria bacterium RIFCSPLOWO2_01_FULL_45_15b]